MYQDISMQEKALKKQHPSKLGFILMCFICGFFFVLFMRLGVWQMHRLTWKEHLIAAVNERAHNPPVLAPGPKEWKNITTEKDAYLPVFAEGHFLNDKEILVTSMEKETTGYFLMTPFVTQKGFYIIVNRGFVPLQYRSLATRQKGNINGETRVTGLLRLNEGPGRLFWKNKPEKNLWYSRDPQQIAETWHLSNVAPYFIDADATPNRGGVPIGGLTHIQFRNAHLSYIITWFTLALGTLMALTYLLYDRYLKKR